MLADGLVGVASEQTCAGYRGLVKRL